MQRISVDDRPKIKKGGQDARLECSYPEETYFAIAHRLFHQINTGLATYTDE